MQSHYIELIAIPQAEILASETISHIMQSIHRVLPAYAGRLGISFPHYRAGQSIGTALRIFGTEDDIRQIFYQLNALGLADYAIIRQPESVPPHSQFACFSRVRPQSPTASSIRRMQKRQEQQGKTPAEIEQAIANWQNKRQDNFIPFVRIQSASTGKTMPLHIHKQSKQQAHNGEFNTYGLSQNATVPVF